MGGLCHKGTGARPIFMAALGRLGTARDTIGPQLGRFWNSRASAERSQSHILAWKDARGGDDKGLASGADMG